MSIAEARELVLKPMSSSEIENYGFRFMTYSDLANFQIVEDLLPNTEYDAVVILVRTKINYGHYVCMVRLNKRLLYFDSYGFRVDKKFYETTEYMRNKINQTFPHLSSLLNDAVDRKFNVSFNEYPFQNQKVESNTCGRWCILFCQYFKINRNKSISDFICFVFNESKRYDNLDLNILVSLLVP
jgi:hypothetical protein